MPILYRVASATVALVVPLVLMVAPPAASGSAAAGSGATAVTGDWNGDGRTDLGWFQDGRWALRNANGSVRTLTFGRAGDVPVVGDWNGNRKDTVGVFRGGRWLLRNTNSGGIPHLNFRYGRAGDQPVVGDWNRNVKDGIGVFRNGRWHLRNALSTGGSRHIFAFGAPGDLAVAGNWNRTRGDGIGVYRTGRWYLRNALSTGGSRYRIAYGGLAADQPVVGDWNRNGTETVGIARGTTWYLRSSHTASKAATRVVFASPKLPVTTTTTGSAKAYGISAGGGLQFLSVADRDRTLDDLVALGVTRVRFDMNWAHIQRDGRDSYDWGRYDGLVDALVARGLEPLATISYTPPWARPDGCTHDDKCAPARLRDYSGFVSNAVQRYKSRGVNEWEIWNEPNIVNFWRPAPDATRYAKMLKLAYSAAKKADADAFVLTAGTSPAADNGTNIAPRTFLSRVYEAGAGGSFDAVAHHPYAHPAAPGEYHEWSAWSQMADTSPSLRSIMVSRGDGHKKIWLTEYGAPTQGPAAVTEARQAQWVTDAYRLLATYEWAGPLFWYNHRDVAGNLDDSFGLRRADWTAKPSWDTYAAATP